MTCQTLLSHSCACLTAGKSPAHWQRNLSDKTRFSTMRRTCGWILPRGSVKLQPEPLLGSCLSELTGSNREAFQAVQQSATVRSILPSAASNQPPIPKARSAQKQTPDNSPSQPRSRQRSASNSATETNPSAQVPLKLEPKASPDLLCRLANKSAPTRIYRPAAEPKPQPSVKPAKADCPLFEQPAAARPNARSFYQPPRSPKVAPLPYCPAAHHRRWLDRLAQHADRRLRRESLDAPCAPGSSPAAQPGITLPAQQSTQQMYQGKPSVPAVGEKQILQQEPFTVQKNDRPFKENSFTAQWSLPIAGQTAPLDLLVYLTRTASTTSPQSSPQSRVLMSSNGLPKDGSSTEGQRARPFQHRQSAETWTANEAQERSSNQPALAASLLPAATGYEGGAVTPGSAHESSQQPLPWSPVRSPNSTPNSTAQIAPPAITPSLPALTAQSGAPAASVAAALTQHQAQQEATAPADLGLLADQIKRILNEEARRHGINL